MEGTEQSEEQFRNRCNTWPRNSNTAGSLLEPVKEENQVKKKGSFFGRRNIYGEWSYSDLITRAITLSPAKQLTLSEIYSWMAENVPVLQNRPEGSASWKNSVRHNLSLHSKFVRIKNEQPGKSSYWSINLHAKPTKTGRKRTGSTGSKRLEPNHQRYIVPDDTTELSDSYPNPKFVHTEPYILPGYQTSPSFRSRAWSSCSAKRLSPNLPNEEQIHTTKPNILPEYQISPPFRPRASSSCSAKRLAPITLEDVLIEVQNEEQVHTTEPNVLPGYQVSPSFRPRALSGCSARGLSPIYLENVLPEVQNEEQVHTTEPYVLPGYQLSPSFRPRSLSSCSTKRLSPIPLENVSSEVPNEEQVHTTEPYVISRYQMSPSRPRAWSNCSKRPSSMCLENISIHIQNEPTTIPMDTYHPYDNQFRCRSYSSGSSSGTFSSECSDDMRKCLNQHYCGNICCGNQSADFDHRNIYKNHRRIDVLSDILRQSNIAPQHQQFGNIINNKIIPEELQTMNTQTKDIGSIQIDIINSTLCDGEEPAMLQTVQKEDIDNIKVDVFNSPLCDVDEVIEHELNMGGTFDFN